MPIHWFPGHMAGARRDIRRVLPEVDLLIEVLDARIPFSSQNPLVDELRGEKPCIRVLNKADMADPATTEAWLASLSVPANSRALVHHQRQPGARDAIVRLAKSLVGPIQARPMMALILGIPNVGKSTLINTLAARTIAKTGNKPAVTQMQQRIAVNAELTLLDTPGFLWPKLTPAACGYRLALTGAIADRVTDFQDLAGFALPFLRARHPDGLVRHYGLKGLPDGDDELLAAIGRRRGFLGKGGVVDLARAAERVVLDLREGALGRMTLETPEDCGVGLVQEP